MSMGKTTIMSKSLLSDAAMATYLAVIHGSDENHCALPGAANVYAIGITQAKTTAAEQEVEVMKKGIAKATAAAAITVGSPVKVHGTTGKLTGATLVAGGSTAVYVVGHATTAATTDGDIFHVDLSPYWATEA